MYIERIERFQKHVGGVVVDSVLAGPASSTHHSGLAKRPGLWRRLSSPVRAINHLT
jgi:hypothetical protein